MSKQTTIEETTSPAMPPYFVAVLLPKNAPAYTWCASKKAIATPAPWHRSK